MISDEYKKVLQETHMSNESWGNSAHAWIDSIRPYIKSGQTILDYGCGKGALKNHVPNIVYEYDPALNIDERQEVDTLICLDVLEHVEEMYLQNVLRDMASYPNESYFIAIHINKAQTTLADGRNAHITLKTLEQWREILIDYFHTATIKRKGVNNIICHGFI